MPTILVDGEEWVAKHWWDDTCQDIESRLYPCPFCGSLKVHITISNPNYSNYLEKAEANNEKLKAEIRNLNKALLRSQRSINGLIDERNHLQNKVLSLNKTNKSEVEWTYGVYETTENILCNYAFFVYNGEYWLNETGKALPEDSLKAGYYYIITYPNEDLGKTYSKHTETPIFGVRKLTDEEKVVQDSNDKYAAFYNGKRIRGTNCLDPKNCINEVLQMLKPATSAITLANLETVDD